MPFTNRIWCYVGTGMTGQALTKNEVGINYYKDVSNKVMELTDKPLNKTALYLFCRENARKLSRDNNILMKNIFGSLFTTALAEIESNINRFGEMPEWWEDAVDKAVEYQYSKNQKNRNGIQWALNQKVKEAFKQVA